MPDKVTQRDVEDMWDALRANRLPIIALMDALKRAIESKAEPCLDDHAARLIIRVLAATEAHMQLLDRVDPNLNGARLASVDLLQRMQTFILMGLNRDPQDAILENWFNQLNAILETK